jgi:hypothetical protein
MMRTQLVSSTVEKYQIEPANPPARGSATRLISMQIRHHDTPNGTPIIDLEPILRAKISAGVEQPGRE